MENNKQTPFLSRVSKTEKTVEELKKDIEILKAQMITIKKVLKR